MIISILGTSGAGFNHKDCAPRKDEEGNILFHDAEYNSDIFNIERKRYKNSTHFLVENFDDEFVFIGTVCAISFQKTILAESLKGKNVQFRTIGDNSLDDIFETILELIQDNDNIVLDITHGFRHQPIMAIFASTLSQFLERRDLKIIFAKEVESHEKYEYIYLNSYIEITQISLLLTGFIRTLNFIPVKNMKLLNNKVFEDFSKSLLSNDLRGVEKNYALLKEELSSLKKNENLKHISQLLIKVEDEINELGMFDFLLHYQKYMLLAKMTVDKNYLVVAYAYIFESLREYCAYRFEEICVNIHFKNDYSKNTAVMIAIGNFHWLKSGTEILKKHRDIYAKNRTEFDKVQELYDEIRIRRNELAHINKDKDFEDIKRDLNEMIKKVEKLFEEEILSEIGL